jgi:pilus assembly protein CpaB
MKKFDGFKKLRPILVKLAPFMGVVFMGATAAALGYYYLRSSEQETVANLEKKADKAFKNVVVPTKPLQAGTNITSEMVASRPVPETFVHSDALTPDTFNRFLGQELTVNVEAGIPLLAAFFAPKKKVFSDEIEPGVRAITIPVDEISSISGLLRAGDRIDFMFVAEQKNDSEGSFVVPLLQDVIVRATGKITADEVAARRKLSGPSASDDPYAKQSFSTVTVGLQPKDAQKLILAQRMGKIIAALRNSSDRETLATGTNSSDLTDSINSLRPTRPASNLFASASNLTASTDYEVEYIVGGAATGSNNNGRANNSTRDAMLQKMAQSQRSGQMSSIAPRQPSEKEIEEFKQQLYRQVKP